MGTRDKASNKAQDVKGTIEKTVGKAIGDEDLEHKGKVDQAESAAKGLGEKVKDTAAKIKDAVTGS